MDKVELRKARRARAPAARASRALWGCLAPHSHLRGAILPTPRQQGVDAETDTRSPCWSLARLLHRVFALDMAQCPFCQRGPAAHRRHHAGRGDPQDPPPSETLRRPTHHRVRPGSPGDFRVRLNLRRRPRRRRVCRAGVTHPSTWCYCCVSTLPRPSRAPLQRPASAHTVPSRAPPCSEWLRQGGAKVL